MAGIGLIFLLIVISRLLITIPPGRIGVVFKKIGDGLPVGAIVAPDDSYHASWFPGVLDAFADAIREPASAAAAANQREALLCQAVIDAAYRSAERNGAEIAVEI